jgi:O-acetyl-ADP-ribose deacetylase (regulator of RNase III)
MKPTFKLSDLIQQGYTALAAVSSLLSQKMAVINCAEVEFLTPGQINALFEDIPEHWDFLALNDVIETGTLCDSVAEQIEAWLSQRSGSVEADQDIISNVTIKGIDKVLAFQSTLGRKGARLYEISAQQSLLAPYIYSNEVNGFIQTLHDEGFILLSFNWGVWLEEANQYVNDPEFLDFADLLTLQKLLTTHIKAERFNSGHLAQLIETGHIVAILKRLATIRKTMTESSLPRLSNLASRITATRGDITQQHVDAIVNTTNISLDIGGGVSEAIHAAAGPGLKEECRRLKGCPVGHAKLTHGYNLPSEWVIHTVGPVWQDGSHNEDALLAQCYQSSLVLAASCPIETIAFPSIGTGFRGFPIERAVHIAVSEVHRFLETNTTLEKVVFVCHNAEVFEAYSKAIRELQDFYQYPAAG